MSDNHAREIIPRLMALGISYEHAHQLRRISMTLQRWFELECGTGEGQTTYSVERETDEDDSQPYMRVQYPTRDGYVDNRWKIADRENGAKRRLARIMANYPTLAPYIQSDPRGAALYICKPEDVRADQYSRGVAVYK